MGRSFSSIFGCAEAFLGLAELLLEAIGSGGTGTVFRARERSLGREVALRLASTALGAWGAAIRQMVEARVQ